MISGLLFVQWTGAGAVFGVLRDIARSTDERMAIFSVLTVVAVGNSAPIASVGEK